MHKHVLRSGNALRQLVDSDPMFRRLHGVSAFTKPHNDADNNPYSHESHHRKKQTPAAISPTAVGNRPPCKPAPSQEPDCGSAHERCAEHNRELSSCPLCLVCRVCAESNLGVLSQPLRMRVVGTQETSYLKVDLFCGAGGSSTGAIQVPESLGVAS